MNALNAFFTWLMSLFSSTGLGASPGPVNASSVYAAIQRFIAAPLGIPARGAALLLAQSALETAHWSAPSFKATQSLFNRHMGYGTAGVPDSDGSWTGRTYNAGPGDEDLRIYTDINQSARDMRQWLSEPIFVSVLQALRRGDPAAFARALDSVGFSTQRGYGEDVAETYSDEFANYA